MTVPERYLDIRDYFEGLQVAGELSDEFKVSIQKIKHKDSIQFVARTSLGKNSNSFYRETYFKRSKFGKEDHYYFPFTLTMDREKDEILIHTSLPSVGVDNNGIRMFVSPRQLIKMYRNGIILDLIKQGFKNVVIDEKSYGQIELKANLGSENGHGDVAKLYELIKKRSITAIKSLRE